MSSKYDIAGQDPLQMVAYGPDDQAQQELDILHWREQSRLQAAVLEAYEAYLQAFALPYDDKWCERLHPFQDAIRAAWAALQHHNGTPE